MWTVAMANLPAISAAVLIGVAAAWWAWGRGRDKKEL